MVVVVMIAEGLRLDAVDAIGFKVLQLGCPRLRLGNILLLHLRMESVVYAMKLVRMNMIHTFACQNRTNSIPKSSTLVTAESFATRIA